jgi:hypothetical protein
MELGAGKSQTKNYTYKPTDRGTYTDKLQITSNDPLHPSQSVTLSGRGVAPVEGVTTTSAGLTRIGTSSQGLITIKNSGDGNLSGRGAVSNLNGTIAPVPAGGVFGGALAKLVSFSLKDGQSQTLHYTYTPTGPTANAATVQMHFADGSSDGKNHSVNLPLTLGGQGVGPRFSSTHYQPGSSLNFGTVEGGHSKTLDLAIRNSSHDANNGHSALTDLTVLEEIISGPDAADFHLAGFQAHKVIHNGQVEYDYLAPEVLHEGQGFDFRLLFAPPHEARPFSATLTLITDERAAFGHAGDRFQFQLNGTGAAPAPSSAILLGIGSLSVGLYTLRRRLLFV